jgi:hypothetical protein
MANSTFNIAQPKGTPKAAKIADTTEIAARNVVYKLLDATMGQPMRWATFHRMYESRAAIARAVERGWVILWGTSGRPLELKAALTEEGRRLARAARVQPRREAGVHQRSVTNQLFVCSAGASTACNSGAGELSTASNNAAAAATIETTCRTW